MEQKSGNSRPPWDDYFMEIAALVATRSTCMRRNVGAVIVRNKHILATGYNGAPRSTPHCTDIGCLRDKLKVKSGERHELCRGTHAEQNAIIQAAANSTSIEDGILYSTHHPCSLCTKMLINAGIRRVYYREGYPDDLARELAAEAGMELIKLG